jgi:predicted ATPase
VEVFLRELVTSGAGCYVARGRCSERLAGSEAYLPMLEALESLVRSADESLNGVMTAVAPTWYAEITPLTQVHSSLRGPLPPGPADRTATERQVASQQRLKRELVALLEELTRLQPVVIFLDDLHWADASTVDVLAYAMTRCASRRILIVAAYRPTELIADDHPFQRVRLELQGHGICRDIPIDFLTREDVDRYLGLQFPEHLFPAELSRRLHERTEGNPLFMADLVRFLRDRGVLAEHEGRWVIVGQLPEAERQLPQSVRSMVDKKISELDDADRRLLTAGSVQRGASSESEIVRAASGHEPEPGVSPARQARRGARDARRDLRVVTEGFDTPDLKDAATLLEQLARGTSHPT